MKRALLFLAAITVTLTLTGCNVTVVRRPPVFIHRQPTHVHTIIHRPYRQIVYQPYYGTRSVYRSSYARRRIICH